MTFKFVESLRNHIQHYGLPVHNFSSHMHWDNEFEHLEHQCLLFATKESLSKDKRFNKKALRQQPEEINLIKTIRLYIESLSTLHNNIRKVIRKAVNNARAIIEGNIERYTRETNHDGIGISAIHAFDGRLADRHSLLLEWDNIRIDLEQKNQQLYNLHKQHVTNRADAPKKSK